ncbi:MAG: hypothetical protein GC146_17430 [Limimaricola sp.]|uniref:hypothetical protein n=1 Tax=Limimaricola sp. TaxID=2211665 RepID=UPI001D7FCA23|nr:hypothetical protein [Limimaricola sp.]MBI1418994.1 hypothetical protein [Limimaricola sp.]
MSRIRTLSDAGPLSAAEQQLVDACKAGETCTLGDGTRPEGPDPARTIRADLLRFLILGGDDACRVDEYGVALRGAFIEGPLDLSFATARGRATMVACRFDQPIAAMQARFETLALGGSALPGLNAQGARIAGSVFLRKGFHATGTVSLAGAEIGGQLDCAGGRFEVKEGDALNAQGARIPEAVFLSDGFHATGMVRLTGAEIGGQLTCVGGRFEVRDGDALQAQRMRVTGSFFWRNVRAESGSVDLADVHVGDLVDDLASWPPAGRLYLDGFTYDRISGAFTDARKRLDWLARGTVWEGEFFPQPYTQLAKVLREMGHEAEARRVLVERERLLDRYRIKRLRAELADLRALWETIWSFLLRWLVGYGYAPFRSIWALAALIVIATGLGHQAWESGDFAPNSAIILSTDDWRTLAEDATVANPAKVWSDPTGPGRDYESFNAWAWGTDLVVPILSLGQTEAWAPSTARGPWGRRLWWARWVLEAFGWIVTALGAAAITGIIRRD